MTGTVNEYQYIFPIIFRSILLRMKNVSGKSCRENQNTFYVRQGFFENCILRDIIWKNIAELDRRWMGNMTRAHSMPDT
jgi:hypothetical protein